jgi:hypothetical protein
MRLMLEPVISTRWIGASVLCAMAACMPSARPLAQIRRTDRDNTVSTIIIFSSHLKNDEPRVCSFRFFIRAFGLIDRQRAGAVRAAHQEEAYFVESGLKMMEILLCLQKRSKSTDGLHQFTQRQ